MDVNVFVRKCEAGEVIVLQVKERNSEGFVNEQKKNRGCESMELVRHEASQKRYHHRKELYKIK
jgi:hypothetical protein